MDAIDAIYRRRSVRSYLPDPVPDETIDMLLKAGCQAASAVNAQDVTFAVVTDPEKISEYDAKGKRLTLENRKGTAKMTPYLERILTSERSRILHNAPAVIFLFTSPACHSPVEDASLAVANIMIAAEASGLGTCWIGLAAGLNDDPGFRKDLGIPEDRTLRATLTLGYPENGDAERKAKKAPVVHGRL